MHRSLALSNLSGLPVHLQRRAKSAAQGSWEDLRSISPLQSVIPQEKRVLLLPIYYALLDPKAIAPLRNIENTSIDAVRLRMALVTYSLDALDGFWSSKITPQAALEDLWDRVWPWVHFLVEFAPYLPPPIWPSGKSQYHWHSYARLLFGYSDDGSCRARPSVVSTPGVLAIVASVWDHLLDVDIKESIPNETSRAVYLLGSFFTAEVFNTQIAMDDLVAGAGSWNAVASLFVRQTRRAFPTVDSPVNTTRRQGFLQANMVVCHALSNSTTPVGVVPSAPMMLNMLWFLIQDLGNERPQVCMVDALRAGLLSVMLSCASGPQREVSRVIDALKCLLERDLPRLSCYAYVLKQLRISLAGISQAELGRALEGVGLGSQWTKFKILLDDRLKLLDTFIETRFTEVLKACDNLQCAQFLEKRTIKRCSCCLITHYCCQACQKADWKDGHR
ncbi:hypothetical protein C8F01DRAFT_1234094, partial [Mycena amicta]